MEAFVNSNIQSVLGNVSTWTVLHAMREIIANAIDAESQHAARKEILYLPDRKTVRSSTIA